MAYTSLINSNTRKKLTEPQKKMVAHFESGRPSKYFVEIAIEENGCSEEIYEQHFQKELYPFCDLLGNATKSRVKSFVLSGVFKLLNTESSGNLYVGMMVTRTLIKETCPMEDVMPAEAIDYVKQMIRCRLGEIDGSKLKPELEEWVNK